MNGTHRPIPVALQLSEGDQEAVQQPGDDQAERGNVFTEEPEVRNVHPDELAQHTSAQALWIAIDGYVYDVTHFHHPGGNDRLFELGGRDATRSFKAIKHSAAAQAHMKTMLVGR
eukprot:6128458-Prymnesium_polylepis.1